MSMTRPISATSVAGRRPVPPRAQMAADAGGIDRRAVARHAERRLGGLSDGTTLPADGFVIGRDAPVRIAANWSPHVFTGTAGSLFIPDNSVDETTTRRCR